MSLSDPSLDYRILWNNNFYVSDDNYDLNIYSAKIKKNIKIQTNSKLSNLNSCNF